MKKTKIISFAAAFILLLLSLLPVMFLKNNGTQKVDVLYFGDSIIAGWSSVKPIPERVAENTGMTVFNGGFGGMTMAQVNDEQYISDRLNMFTMVSISEAVKNKDFSLLSMSSGRGSEQIVEYWINKAEELSTIDLSSVKYVIIEFGANDFFSDTPLDNTENAYDLASFAGALRYSVKNIKEGMPNARIIVESPIFNTVFIDSGNINNCGLSIKDYVETERAVALELGIDFINTYELSGINEGNTKMYLSDGLHTNADGDIRISDCITDFINSLE